MEILAVILFVLAVILFFTNVLYWDNNQAMAMLSLVFSGISAVVEVINLICSHSSEDGERRVIAST